MKKRMIVAVVLTAVALGRASTARAACFDGCPAIEEDGFAEAQKKIAEMIAKQRDERKVSKGLKDLGFKIRKVDCGSNVAVMTFGDKSSDGSFEIRIRDYRLEVDQKGVVAADSATDFLSKTKDLELIKKMISDIKAIGLVEKNSDLSPRSSCRNIPFGP